MNTLAHVFGDPALGPLTVALRLLAAILCGAIVGIEREWRQHNAGLRTHIMIALAAALFAVIAMQLLAEPFPNAPDLRIDPLRLVQAVTAGVGFLAAGVVIVRHRHVHGLTTGAGMWLAAAIGLACGLGFFSTAIMGAGFGFIVLSLLRWLEIKAEFKDGKDRRQM